MFVKRIANITCVFRCISYRTLSFLLVIGKERLYDDLPTYSVAFKCIRLGSFVFLVRLLGKFDLIIYHHLLVF